MAQNSNENENDFFFFGKTFEIDVCPKISEFREIKSVKQMNVHKFEISPEKITFPKIIAEK